MTYSRLAYEVRRNILLANHSYTETGMRAILARNLGSLLGGKWVTQFSSLPSVAGYEQVPGHGLPQLEGSVFL